jgi:ABC-type multidrug transport system, ATPase component
MSEPFIVVDDLRKSFKKGSVKAVDGVSFTVNRGDAFGLIGPNGAGKTTVLGCMLGLLHPSSGSVTIDGHSPYDEEVKRITGFLPERPSYNRWMKVRHFLQLHHSLAGRPVEEREVAIDEVLTEVELDLAIVKNRKIRELSRGMLQRVGLAQALIGKPKLCFLDEPTQGMDPLGFMLVRKLLVRMKREGITVILNSHHLHEVERVCDQVAFIRAGKIESVEALAADLQERHIFMVRWVGTESGSSQTDSDTESGSIPNDKIENTLREVEGGTISLLDFEKTVPDFLSPTRKMLRKPSRNFLPEDFAFTNLISSAAR